MKKSIFKTKGGQQIIESHYRNILEAYKENDFNEIYISGGGNRASFVYDSMKRPSDSVRVRMMFNPSVKSSCQSWGRGSRSICCAPPT